MPKFYFTYGCDGHPFNGGWTEVTAESEIKARKLFAIVHAPVHENGPMPCSFVYTEEAMEENGMLKKGNFGKFCVETIMLDVGYYEEPNRKCPVCGKYYSDYPALSRKDNKTEICPDCGFDEAMYDYANATKKKGEI